MDSASSLEMNSVHEKIPGSPLRVPPSPSRFSMSPKLDRLGSIHLNMSQVIRATHNFSPSMMLGEGGFGTVYKAQLPDSQVVAIKRAKKVSCSFFPLPRVYSFCHNSSHNRINYLRFHNKLATWYIYHFQVSLIYLSY